MQDKKTVTTKERLAQLIEELNPEEQSAVVTLLESIVADRKCKCSDIWERAGSAPTLWEAGVDAQDWVDHLRGKRCG